MVLSNKELEMAVCYDIISHTVLIISKSCLDALSFGHIRPGIHTLRIFHMIFFFAIVIVGGGR